MYPPLGPLGLAPEPGTKYRPSANWSWRRLTATGFRLNNGFVTVPVGHSIWIPPLDVVLLGFPVRLHGACGLSADANAGMNCCPAASHCESEVQPEGHLPRFARGIGGAVALAAP